MLHYRIRPSPVTGSIAIPPSKSQTLRALLFASLAEGESFIKDLLPSHDTAAMRAACVLFGATLEEFDQTVKVRGVGGIPKQLDNVIDAGNSGIVLRFCTAIGALMDLPCVVTGDHSIRHQRPMAALLDGLSQWGVRTESLRGDGFAPVVVRGPVKGGRAEICGQDSQPVSALVIAGSLASAPVQLEVQEPGEGPWIDLTLSWLDRMGVAYEREGYSRYALKGGARWKGFSYHVPGDLSSAAFPAVAALIGGNGVSIENVNLEDPQGDKKLFSYFQEMGADIHYDAAAQRLDVRGGRLKGIKADLNDCIDGIAALAALACYAEGETLIYNASVARTKECNRIRSLVEELSKMGASISETADGLSIRGKPLVGAEVHSHGDHRMAMALSVAASGAKGESVVKDVSCVGKTFPGFQKAFKKLGLQVEEVS